MRPNPNTSQIDDRVIAGDVLATSKMLADTCAKYAIESYSPGVRQTMASIYMEKLSGNEKIFRFMENRGWYPVEKADQQSISQIHSKFSATETGYYGAQYGPQPQGVGQETQLGKPFQGQYTQYTGYGGQTGQYPTPATGQTGQYGAQYNQPRY